MLQITTKYASIDFEFYDTAEEKLNVVCGSIRHDGKTTNYWTHRDSLGTKSIVEKIEQLHKEGYTFLAYAVTAEARSFISLLLNPKEYRWIDLYLEYRCLSNHNDNYAYGKQLIGGRKKFTKKPLPKWMRKTEADEKKADASKQEYGYGAAVYKTLGLVIDTDFKTEIRNIIIACNTGCEEAIQTMISRKEEIMEYCGSDVEHLEPMFKEMINEYKRLFGRRFHAPTLREDIRTRAEYAVRTAIQETVGYPISVNRTRNFSSQVANIIWSCQDDINSQFPFTGGDRIFRNKVQKRPLDLSWNQQKTRDLLRKWMEENNYKNWTLTDGGKSGIKDLSLSLKAFQKPISYSHTYPKGDFIAQMQRYLKLKQGLNGFTANDSDTEGEGNATKKKKKFWDYVGQDGRVRPFMGIYGAQSARSQPSAISFIPLKAAWMRALIEPPKSRVLCGIDYASQEFLLAALLSGDKAMLSAYESGDVYLAFGKSIGFIPSNGTKKTHKEQRDQCKAVVLGLSYDMSEYGLATDLSEKFGRKVTPEEALGWIKKHKKAYPVFWRWKDALQRHYKLQKHIRLADGWMVWGDNDNFRSIGNVPIQGMGSCIMRKAVALAQDAGLDVVYTLHDAIYIEYDSSDTKGEAVSKLATCMDEAFRWYFEGELKAKATVRLDADIWSQDFEDKVEKFEDKYITDYGYMTLEVKKQQMYIDERAIDDFNKFSPYFEEADYMNMEF